MEIVVLMYSAHFLLVGGFLLHCLLTKNLFKKQPTQIKKKLIGVLWTGVRVRCIIQENIFQLTGPDTILISLDPFKENFEFTF